MTAGLWMVHLPVLSTAHVSLATSQALETMAHSGRGHDVVGLAQCAGYEYGWFMSFDQSDEPGEMTEDIAALYAWAGEHGYEWIRMDADGDLIDALPQHTW